MEKLVITLKQQTPLIHFQHEQDGATLRASEVKPKLDKFIITKLGGSGGYKTGIEHITQHCPGYFSKNNENHSLNYKLKIVNNEGENEQYMIASYIKEENITKLIQRKIQVIPNSPYFAQESNNNSIINQKTQWNNIPKKGIRFSGEITVTISLFDNKYQDIVTALKTYIQDFFIVHNFGTRQNKGFGVYYATKITYVNEKQTETINLRDIELILKENFLLVYKKEISDNLQILFSTINNDYRLLKSGSNRPYRKSMLMTYFLNEKIRWEKKYIKSHFFNAFKNGDKEYYMLKSKIERPVINKNNTLNYKYIRALLGLSEQYEFLLKNPPENDSKNKLIVKIKPSDTNIQRYQSPLLFKVYNGNLYLVGNDVSEEIKGATISFLANIQKDNGYKNELLGDPLTVPKNFSLPKFMKYALEKDNSIGYTRLQNNY